MANFDKAKNSAPLNTVTYNKTIIEAPTGNIYKAINIIAKRSNQINIEVKKELIDKLEEFATYNDSLEEVFENKEQIEVSRYFEKLPKSHSIALEEWMDGKIYYRDTTIS
jgi:DNA-directed RNA polymerase subunit K/omega